VKPLGAPQRRVCAGMMRSGASRVRDRDLKGGNPFLMGLRRRSWAAIEPGPGGGTPGTDLEPAIAGLLSSLPGISARARVRQYAWTVAGASV
jgi:hypothetical protein